MKIAIQGIRGAFHEAAALKHFGDTIEIVECDTFKSLCDTLKSSIADKALMAIENSIAGSILGNYTLIHEYGFYVIGEVYLNIKMNLMTIPGVAISDISVVESHPIALQQCQEYIHKNLNATCKESNDTAESARNLSLSSDTSKAIIASKICSELYNLEIKQEGIETHKQNFTRFLILGREDDKSLGNNKASLRLQLGNEVGSLANVLVAFKENEVNLTKIQSIPIIGAPYEYDFHIDVEWADYDRYQSALAEVETKTRALSLLGEYKKSSFELNQ
ncbi:prephenate dehydratase [Fulvivirga sp. 29W222]|uniref:prephenate dehydratase n=1 Tax=Fulvivirga marina TaxID=2494733 RepID=A0A937G159_9BACT|nr:prephenate dehydratase [Fulvivirga marina]MBL6448647.1 prephenate dehydratase [Fulvivirga marina]